MDKQTEDLALKLLGIKDPDAYRAQVKRELIDYARLLTTMDNEEFVHEIGEQFSNPRQVAIIAAIMLMAQGSK